MCEAVSSNKRLLLTLEYDGTAYCGWQRQINGPSVQQSLEEALEKLLGRPIRVTGASRTDAGVHALGQRAHFDMAGSIPPDKLPYALNTLLPRDIRALQALPVQARFHARFDARGKEYGYTILNRRHASALERHRSAHVPLPLEEKRMAEAAAVLLGRHDFAAFQAAGGTAKTTVRTIRKAAVARQGNLVRITVEGDAFLYNMVRIIAGTLILIGQDKLPMDSFAKAIEHKDRLLLGPTAPAQGLCLHRVWYEGEEL